MKMKTKLLEHFQKQGLRAILLAMSFLSASLSFAYDFNVDGIYYRIIGSEVSVTYKDWPMGNDHPYNDYSGNIAIPAAVTYNGNSYSVTSIDYCAFYFSAVSSVTIPNTVTTIGESAFNESLLTNVTIGNSVTTISREAFSYCTRLTSVTIPESVTTIGPSAFSYSGLTSVTIPNSVTSIGGSAFYACSRLSNITVGNSVAIIGSEAFTGTPWYENQPNGIVYAGLVAYKYKGTMPSNTSLVLRDGTLGVASGAFKSRTGLTNVTIPESVISICSESFYGCTGLTSLTIPNSVTSIYESAFYGCTGITNVTIGNSVTFIGKSAFYGCTGMTSVTIGNSVTTIGESAFYKCSSLANIHLTDIAAWFNISFESEYSNPLCYSGKLYLNGNELIDLIIPNSVTSIGKCAFYGCSSLSSVIIPSSVISIGQSAFCLCNNLANISIGNSVTTISGSAFYGCNSLTSVTIPESVSSIGQSAFENCSELKTLNYNAIDCDGFSSNSVFNNTSISVINIGENVKIIPSYFAYKLSKLSNLRIGNSVTSIGVAAFSGCSSLSSVTIPESVINLGGSAFSGCSDLTSVTVPNYVTTIGNQTFYGCTSLSSVIIGHSVISIGEKAFYGCGALTNVSIPNSVSSIGASAFYNCTGMISVTIGNSVSSIGKSAFDNCTGLTCVNITDIAAWCGISFYNYTEMYSFHTSNPLSIAHHLYLNGSEITNLVIPNTVSFISEAAFCGYTEMNSVTIPNSVAAINDYVFYYCTGLKNAKLPKTLKSIGNYAFYSCSSLANLTIPNSVTTIGSYSFQKCSNLESVTVPNSVTTIGNSAFRNCSGLKSATITSHLTSLGDYAFYGCSALSSFTCMPETPPILNYSSSFGTYNTTSLYVPRSGVEDYKTSNWRWFAKIYEFVGNFTVPNVNVSKGKTVVVPVSMTNEADIIGFQTDIYLPEGFEFVKDGNDYVVDPSDRMARDHSIMCNVSDDGALRVLCFSPTNKVINGNEGELFYVTIKAPNDTVGDFSLCFKNTILTTSDAEELLSPDAYTNINVIPYLPGDANGNGEVSVIDIVTAAQYIIFQNPDPFLFEAADLNNDEQITVTDLALIANLILYPTMSAPKRVPVLELSEEQIHGNDIQLNVGETRTVTITLDNLEEYSAFQMDVKLPSGLIASNFKLTNQSSSHTLITSEENDGVLRALCYSPSLEALDNDEETLLTFDVTSTGSIVGDIIFDGIELVTTTCQPVHLDALAISVNQSSTVNEVTSGKIVDQIEYYNLAGQKLAKPTQGVTIVVTTYTDGSRLAKKIIL